MQRSAHLKRAIQDAMQQPRCFGIAKNFMTNALKANPQAALPQYPWIFNKPLTSVKPNYQDFSIPWHAAEDATVHEVELGVIMNGLKAHEASWQDRIGAYCIILDMGDMSMIKNALTNGLSWTIAKQQNNFLVLGDLLPKEAIPDPHNVDLLLSINGEVRQKDNTGNMIFKIDQQIDYLENVANIQLREGDLLLSGTPENIAPVREGDRLEASISTKGQLISSLIEPSIVRDPKPSHIV